ncbi:succinate dehydrogenase assembly factor 4, mitochondrial-like [Thrips palmi]|uniref:Succinate dehydrogenase assembly factor 4, mitochondrial n=1 Tax=Thrips palmi TaxID=161013 RepID=A0A6P8YI50_THRPL|nr:succinate dehydrogenase assembly factor 4, mitochondrial-like [Thrips palmi]
MSSLTYCASMSRRLVKSSFPALRNFNFQFNKCYSSGTGNSPDSKSDESCKAANLAKKLRAKTPIGKLDELDEGKHPFQEKEPLPPWPNNTNPHTGEVGGPKGPEPTRYGDWERKGRVSDF